MRREPAIIIGGVTAVIEAIIALVVALGLDLSPEVQASLMGLVAVVGTLAATLWTRESVYAPDTYQRQEDRTAAVVDLARARGVEQATIDTALGRVA